MFKKNWVVGNLEQAIETWAKRHKCSYCLHKKDNQPYHRLIYPKVPPGGDARWHEEEIDTVLVSL